MKEETKSSEECEEKGPSKPEPREQRQRPDPVLDIWSKTRHLLSDQTRSVISFKLTHYGYGCSMGNWVANWVSFWLVEHSKPLLHNQSGKSEQPRAPCESQTDFNIQLQQILHVIVVQDWQTREISLTDCLLSHCDHQALAVQVGSPGTVMGHTDCS